MECMVGRGLIKKLAQLSYYLVWASEKGRGSVWARTLARLERKIEGRTPRDAGKSVGGGGWSLKKDEGREEAIRREENL